MRRVFTLTLLSFACLCVFSRLAWLEVTCRKSGVSKSADANLQDGRVTFDDLSKSPESYAGKRITITCYVSSDSYAYTRMYKRYKDSFLQGLEGGPYLIVDDQRLVFGETPTAVPSYADVTGVFKLSAIGRKGYPYVGILERIENMQFRVLKSEDMANENLEVN